MGDILERVTAGAGVLVTDLRDREYLYGGSTGARSGDLAGEEQYTTYRFYYNTNIVGDAASWEENTFSVGECMSDALKEASFTLIDATVSTFNTHIVWTQIGVNNVVLSSGFYDKLTATSLGLTYSEFQEVYNAITSRAPTDDGVSATGAVVGGDILTDVTLTDDLTVAIPIYTYTPFYLYDASRSLYTLFEGGAALGGGYLPDGAVGIIGHRDGDIGSPASSVTPTYDSDHIREYIYSDNTHSFSYKWLPATGGPQETAASNEFGLYTPAWDTEASDHESKLVFDQQYTDEARYLDKIFGTGATSAYDIISSSLNTTLSDISARIYGTMLVDRYAFSKTAPQALDVNEIREFSGIEETSPTTITTAMAITASAGSSGTGTY